MEERSTYHHGELRAALVNTAEQLIRKFGADAFSLRENARVIGVTPNACYRHFPDKGALLTEVSKRGFHAMAIRMNKATARADRTPKRTSEKRRATERFIFLGEAYVDFARVETELFRVMFGPHGASCMTEAEKQVHSPYRLLGQALDQLVQVGVFSKACRTGAELRAWTVVHGFACLVIDGATVYPSKASERAALRSVLEFAVRGLATPPARLDVAEM
jgi:AcrR family transcriptional regulator